MAFVRVKNINGNRYGYLVENTWQRKGSRQQVKAYLGKVLRPDRAGGAETLNTDGLSFHDSILNLISWTLQNHGFEKNGTTHTRHETQICLNNKTIRHKGKNAVIELNEGFLCNHTLQQLLNFVGEGTREDEVGQRLASTLLEAGLEVPQEIFVNLFKKTFKPLPEA